MKENCKKYSFLSKRILPDFFNLKKDWSWIFAINEYIYIYLWLKEILEAKSWFKSRISKVLNIGVFWKLAFINVRFSLTNDKNKNHRSICYYHKIWHLTRTFNAKNEIKIYECALYAKYNNNRFKYKENMRIKI